jgi:hypothetical protein
MFLGLHIDEGDQGAGGARVLYRDAIDPPAASAMAKPLDVVGKQGGWGGEDAVIGVEQASGGAIEGANVRPLNRQQRTRRLIEKYAQEDPVLFRIFRR